MLFSKHAIFALPQQKFISTMLCLMEHNEVPSSIYLSPPPNLYNNKFIKA